MKKIIPWLVVLLVAGGVISFLVVEAKKPGKYDDIAKCITDSGTKFYGAFWCPHCQSQKAIFGKSAKKLPYIECSTSDGKGQLSVCTDIDIKGYPTWIFPDGTRINRDNITPQEFAEKLQCSNSSI